MWLERAGEWIEKATQEPWVTKGYVVRTQQERDAYLAAQQAAADAAAAEAALLASMPAQFPTGVAVPVPDSAGQWFVLEPVADGEPVVALTASNSPLSPTEWVSIKAAAKARYDAERTARQSAISELGLTQAQIDSIKAYFDADVDTLFSGLTAGQRNFMKVQRALVKALTKQAVKEVR
jgi:hypothetical protein